MKTDKKTYETQIEISATPQHVWQALTQHMPKSPTLYGITRLEGQIARGARIKLWSEVAPNRAFALKVTALEAPGRMVWQGGMPLGLFTGRRVFTVTAQVGGCVFHMREDFTGPLSGVITKSMPDLSPSFSKFADALKTQAENQ